MDKRVVKYIKKRSAQWDIPFPEDVEQRLVDIERSFSQKNIRVKFVFDSYNGNILNACAGFFQSSPIRVYQEWAAYLILRGDNADVKNAFLCTIGHELTHQEGKDISPFRHFLNIRFIAWVNEIHADFGAEDKMLEQSRSCLIAAMKFKQSQKKKDRDSCTHPSWKRRIHYAESFEIFDEKLIRQIAKDTRCKDKKIIQKVVNYYTK